MRDIGERMYNEGYDIEYHHCPSDPKSVDAIVIDELKICLLDGTPPHGRVSKNKLYKPHNHLLCLIDR